MGLQVVNGNPEFNILGVKVELNSFQTDFKNEDLLLYNFLIQFQAREKQVSNT